MGLLEPITHKEEIEKLINDAESLDQDSLHRFEKQKQNTTNSLEKLGEEKIKAWSNCMDSFVKNFKAFNNIEVIKSLDTNMNFIGCDESPQEMMIHLEEATFTANEIAKMGVAAVGSGALIGIASYGGAMMFGHASTGTAIATLSGVAKKNATLAWFGGGSKAAGGLGMAGGSVVLAGIVVAPILITAGIIAGAKGKERLAEAKKIYAEAENVASQRDYITTGMHAIETMSNQYNGFIKKVSARFVPFIKEIERIKNTYPVSADGTIDFDLLTVAEQKTLHLSWLMAQIFYSVLNQQIMTEDGMVSNEASNILKEANKSVDEFKKETSKLRGEEAKAGDIFWKKDAQKMTYLSLMLCGLLAVIGVLTAKSHFFSSLKYFIAIVIACPIFFKFTDLAESQKYTYRIIRMIAAIVFVIALTFIFR